MRYLIFLLTSLLLFSCTVSKRVHKKGYHISWNKSIDKNSSDKSYENTKLSDSSEASQNQEIQLSPLNKIVKNKTNSPTQVEVETRRSKTIDTVLEPNIDKSRKTSIQIVETKKTYNTENKIENNNKQPEVPEKRRFPLALFLLIILLLMVPFSVISFVLGLVIWATIAELLAFTLAADILGVFIAALLIVSLFYGLFYIFFILFYSNDPYYKNDDSKFRKDFWKVSSWMLLIFLLIIGVFLWLLAF
ncbi:MAG: hypothetical protein WEA99_11680 [Brumimicrobium sp.]